MDSAVCAGYSAHLNDGRRNRDSKIREVAVSRKKLASTAFRGLVEQKRRVGKKYHEGRNEIDKKALA